MIASPKHLVGVKAFTLLELILVMIIMCTVLAMAAPSLRGFFSSHQLGDIAEQILIMTRYSKIQSVFESRPFRVNIDPNLRRYWISSLGESQYKRLKTNYGNYFLIPADIEIDFKDMDKEDGIYYFQFNPEGYSKEARLRLEDKQDNVLEVVCRNPAENYEIIKIANGKEYDY